MSHGVTAAQEPLKLLALVRIQVGQRKKMGRPADWRRRLSRKQVAGNRVRVRLSLCPR